MDNGYLNWYEYAPTDNLYMIKYTDEMNNTKEVSQSGIVLSVNQNSVLDRPSTGIIVSRGVDTSKYDIGMQVFFDPNVSFDLAMIISEENEKYMLVPEDRIDGYRVKDIREI
jgi:hypothetical protein